MEVDNGQLLQTLNPIRMAEVALESLNATLVSIMPAEFLGNARNTGVRPGSKAHRPRGVARPMGPGKHPVI